MVGWPEAGPITSIPRPGVSVQRPETAAAAGGKPAAALQDHAPAGGVVCQRLGDGQGRHVSGAGLTPRLTVPQPRLSRGLRRNIVPGLEEQDYLLAGGVVRNNRIP